MLLRDPDLFVRPLAEGLGGIAEPFKRPLIAIRMRPSKGHEPRQ
jgi:hypothetical protein